MLKLAGIVLILINPSPSNVNVHIFWEGHKILWNLYCRFDRYYIVKTTVEIWQIFVAFSECLRKLILVNNLLSKFTLFLNRNSIISILYATSNVGFMIFLSNLLVERAQVCDCYWQWGEAHWQQKIQNNLKFLSNFLWKRLQNLEF